MTDDQITRHLAEKLMGWTVTTRQYANGSSWLECLDVDGFPRILQPMRPANEMLWFWPLEDARATEKVLIALTGKGYTLRVRMGPESIGCCISEIAGFREVGYADSDNWKRALCLAACRATGGPDAV